MFIVTPEGIAIAIVDVDALREALAKYIFQQLKASVAVEDIQPLLPFQSGLELGNTHVHITNESAYPVSTQYHVIGNGDTLCKRGTDSRGTVSGAEPTCPGCVAKARGVIVNHLMEQFAGDPFSVALALKQV
jgi:hypothetical protein